MRPRTGGIVSSATAERGTELTWHLSAAALTHLIGSKVISNCLIDLIELDQPVCFEAQHWQIGPC